MIVFVIWSIKNTLYVRLILFVNKHFSQRILMFLWGFTQGDFVS